MSLSRPWESEPSREEFQHAGFPCLIQRGPSQAWCGYVGVPPGHPVHGKGHGGRYDEDGNYVGCPTDALNVHGGVTYAHECSKANGICHVPAPGEPDDVWWLGFDCAHSGDYKPKYDSLDFLNRHWDGSGPCTYRDINYVRCETMRLAEQLRRMHADVAVARGDVGAVVGVDAGEAGVPPSGDAACGQAAPGGGEEG